MNLNPIQKSAVITAIQKALKPESDQARHDANEMLHDLYDQTGSDRVASLWHSKKTALMLLTEMHLMNFASQTDSGMKNCLLRTAGRKKRLKS